MICPRCDYRPRRADRPLCDPCEGRRAAERLAYSERMALAAARARRRSRFARMVPPRVIIGEPREW